MQRAPGAGVSSLALAEAAAGGRTRQRCQGGDNAPAIDEEDAERLRRPRAPDHRDVLDVMQQGIATSISGLTNAFRQQVAAAARRATEDPIERLYKRRKLAVEAGRQDAVDRYGRQIEALEAAEENNRDAAEDADEGEQ